MRSSLIVPIRGFLGSALVLVYVTSCAAHAPKVVSISTPTYVPIPPELSADCPIPAIGVRTVGGAIEYAITLKGALQECSDRMGAIRGIQGSPVK